ncbi:MAG TPA: SdrD B-like domain-containing protein [Gillisia sp.]|nr:SdrD B-like domain-containing protein [Gillisia sp.]
MKSIYYFLAIVVVMGTFTACEPANELQNLNESILDGASFNETPSLTKEQVGAYPAYFSALLDNYKEVKINTYTVKLLSRQVDGMGVEATTTFNYEVRGNGETPQLDSFTFELPSCAGELISYSPQQAAGVSQDQIKWNQSISKDGSQTFSLTYKGEIPLGVISATATRGSILETSLVQGPCAGVYNLSGSIYIDANESGIKDPEETGIAFISVDLINKDTGEKIGSLDTGENGLFSFKVFTGNYSIAVGEDLLEDSNYTAVGENFIDVPNVTKDLTGFNFGYLLNSSKVTNDLENKVILVNTEPTKFWQQVIGRKGPNKDLYPPSVIRGFLLAVENSYLDGPFFFGEDKEKAALDILSKPIKTDLDFFLQQLLTAELNVVSGKGALLPGTKEQNKKFNDALLIYAEAVACRETGNCAVESSAANAELKAISSRDTRLLSAFNGSGGI